MSAKTPKSKAYGRVVEDAELENVRLIGSAFKVSPFFREDDETIDRNIGFETELLHRPEYDREERLLVGIAHCSCWMDSTARASNDSPPKEGPERVLTVDADYVLVFRIKNDHEEEALTAFFDRIAPISVWPYFRVHVASVAAEGNIDIPVLPIKKLVHRIETVNNLVDPDQDEHDLKA